eukprot:CAMPEP_0167763482 /NCGR_PEP_ID=MMETSP0110_2-20121227/13402_1 /TAXON_ID=629695 /ORGANISM="Gymnochlora sp., Strain CCMP2014" /LENGTH=198 /DNA_ID=CAMNT_0007650581 /DNA_START=164 /DNA_END=757 /DNA_ORIENTATION=+
MDKISEEGISGQSPLIFCGPSGVGKGTLLRMLFSDFDGKFDFCVSHTTRKPRKGEIHGKHYYFVDKKKMEKAIAAGLFVEHASFAGNMYGTSVGSLCEVAASGKVPVLEVDIQGAIQLNEKKDLKPVFCFVKPPSYEQLESRLKHRGTEDPQKIERRLQRAKVELDFIDSADGKFFQIIFVNDKLDESYKYLKTRLLQ